MCGYLPRPVPVCRPSEWTRPAESNISIIPRSRPKRQKLKYSRIEDFGKYLPQLRAATNEHITLDGLPREKVLAVMMRLINSLYFRVGTEKSAKHYRTYGITTLQISIFKSAGKGN
jgi:DNA topoisomerase IB